MKELNDKIQELRDKTEAFGDKMKKEIPRIIEFLDKQDAELKEARAILRRISILTDKKNTDTNDLFKTVSLVNCIANDYFRKEG